MRIDVVECVFYVYTESCMLPYSRFGRRILNESNVNLGERSGGFLRSLSLAASCQLLTDTLYTIKFAICIYILPAT